MSRGRRVASSTSSTWIGRATSSTVSSSDSALRPRHKRRGSTVRPPGSHPARPQPACAAPAARPPAATLCSTGGAPPASLRGAPTRSLPAKRPLAACTVPSQPGNAREHLQAASCPAGSPQSCWLPSRSLHPPRSPRPVLAGHLLRPDTF
eukprot:449713-Prymnesium_polylepis.1